MGNSLGHRLPLSFSGPMPRPRSSWYHSMPYSCFLSAGGASLYASLLNILLYFLSISL